MSDIFLFWFGMWLVLLVAFMVILYKERDRKLYFLYFIFGMVLGLYFDILSFTFGHYSYPEFFPLKIFGLPFSMTIAEGFAVVITMRLFKALKCAFLK